MLKFAEKLITIVKEKVIRPIKDFFNTDNCPLTPFEYFEKCCNNKEFYEKSKEIDKVFEYKSLLNRLDHKLDEVNLSSIFGNFDFWKIKINIYPKILTYKKSTTDIVLIKRSDYLLLTEVLKRYLKE